MQSEGTKKLARRDVLRAAAGLTAAGALVGVPALVFTGNGGGRADGDRVGHQGPAAGLTQPLVAYVQDADRGEVVIMTGMDQVMVVDRGLVARLIGAGRV